MEFDEIVVKESPGLCRCCLSEGCYKDMGTEYSWMNDNEVYADMLLECFDISISQHNDGPNGPNRLICEVCITRLRDACYFKKQVLDSEKKFVDMIGRGEFRPKVLFYQAQLKSEAVDETPADDAEVEYLEDEMDFGDDEPLKSLSLSLEADSEAGADAEAPADADVTASPLPARAKRGRPKKTALKTEKKKLKTEKTKTKTVVKDKRRVVKKRETKPSEGVVESKDNVITPKKRLTIMRENVVQILLKSTVMPFRWLKSSYRCFYCYDVFQEPKDLKAHQIVHTSDEDKPRAMRNFWEPTVYVDVSNMACRVCQLAVKDFYQMLDHLVDEHSIPFDKDVGASITPFRLDQISVQCVQCDKEYRTFGHLMLHTNKDHKGFTQVLCDICGQHFRNGQHLRDHINKEHINRVVVCPLCGEEISSYHRMRTHMQNFHNKKYKCFACAELFETHYKRSLHMMTVHKSREEVKCQHCPKTFVFRSTMMRHVRETHLQERNAVCRICGWRAFGENRLQRHMMKHSNERNFKCPVCEKAFKTKKTMKQHYSNIHQKGVSAYVPELMLDEIAQNGLNV